MKKEAIILLCGIITGCSGYTDRPITIPLHQTIACGNGTGETLGKATFYNTSEGLKICVKASHISSGQHGFHIHQNADCSASSKNGKLEKAGNAGGHYDPLASYHHDGPYGSGHKGDLPPLYANESGNIDMCIVAPRLKINDILNRSVIIHAGGDNFSDYPHALGGGGERIACGIIKTK